MDALTVRVLLPNREVCLHINLLEPVQGHYIELPHGFIVLRRIPCRHDDPPFRHSVGAESLSLKELEHSRRQSLRHTVYLIDKKDTFLHPRMLHLFIHRGNDLAHRIFRHRILPSSVFFLADKREPHGALPGMVGNGIRRQTDLQFFCNLFHDLRFPDSRRSHEEHRALSHCRYLIFTKSIL